MHSVYLVIILLFSPPIYSISQLNRSQTTSYSEMVPNCDVCTTKVLLLESYNTVHNNQHNTNFVSWWIEVYTLTWFGYMFYCYCIRISCHSKLSHLHPKKGKLLVKNIEPSKYIKFTDWYFTFEYLRKFQSTEISKTTKKLPWNKPAKITNNNNDSL